LQKIGVPAAFKAKELALSFKPIIHIHFFAKERAILKPIRPFGGFWLAINCFINNA
jgi:hypothetical protein